MPQFPGDNVLQFVELWSHDPRYIGYWSANMVQVYRSASSNTPRC